MAALFPTCTYRDAGTDDAATLAAIFRVSFTETFAHLYRPEDLTAFLADFTDARWKAEIADQDFAFHLAEIDGKAVGYVKLGPPSLPVERSEPSVELRQLYLLPEAQGTGAGAALMDWTLGEARARGAAALYLSVYVDNHRAKRFYAKLGFERVGRYTFMVGNQADEDDVMRLGL